MSSISESLESLKSPLDGASASISESLGSLKSPLDENFWSQLSSALGQGAAAEKGKPASEEKSATEQIGAFLGQPTTTKREAPPLDDITKMTVAVESWSKEAQLIKTLIGNDEIYNKLQREKGILFNMQGHLIQLRVFDLFIGYLLEPGELIQIKFDIKALTAFQAMADYLSR